MEFIIRFFNKIKQDSSTESQKKHRYGLVLFVDILILFFISYVTVSDFLTGNTDYQILSVLLLVLYAISLLLAVIFKGGVVSNTFFCCTIALNFLYSFYIRGNNGVGAIWLLLLPLVTMYIIGLSYGFYSSLFVVFGLAFLFIVPYTRDALLQRYSIYFLIRYILLYITAFILTTISMYNFHKLRLKQNADHKELEDAVINEHNKVMAISMQTIISISNAVEAKNNLVGKHSLRVAHFSCLLAEQLGWEEAELRQLHTVAMLHDLGKIGVDSSILNKESDLTDEEFEKMKRHTIIGGDILKDFTIIPNVHLGAYYHHERYDGKGYPEGLAGADIPIEARIVCVADAFDAMRYPRGFKECMKPEEIREEFLKGKGSQFDPELVDLFIKICEENDWFSWYEV